MRLNTPAIILVLFFSCWSATLVGQNCTNLGQTPATAFPVCGTSTFHQAAVPLCGSTNVAVPGCSPNGADAGYSNRNPFFYKFTCFEAGTLAFLIDPIAENEDYDWQLWDVTNRDPNDVFGNISWVVAANWAGTYGSTGASAAGLKDEIQCGSAPNNNRPPFAFTPTLIQGHEYLLMVSHFTDGQSGYDLSFMGGTAVITDPTEPHLVTASPDCDGQKITLKLNKRVKCSSLSDSGDEFSILPALATVVSASSTQCGSAFDFDEVTITLSNPVPSGTYQLVIKEGSDGNSLLDNCNRGIPENEQVSFQYFVPQPIFADSIGTVSCAPTSINIYFPKKIDCNTISPDGSDFAVTGPSAVTVRAASAVCTNDQTTMVTLTFNAPVYHRGIYTVTLKAGIDGTTIIDECGLELPVHTRTFTAADTVSADFTYTSQLDCRFNTLQFAHNGAHNVNSWNWTVNNGPAITTATHTAVFSASSNNQITLIVGNGVCKDTVTKTVTMNNEVIAAFEMPPVICPEDKLQLVNTSTGLIDTWRWNFQAAGSSTAQTPAPFLFPANNRETNYLVKLVATNAALGCSDSMQKKLTVLNNCFIAVPSAFTPNGDGLNDYLYPNNAIKAENLEFRVYNRWGQLVFLSRDWTKKWDGKINGMMQTSGVFVWFLSYTHRDTGQKIFQKGTTTLIL